MFWPPQEVRLADPTAVQRGDDPCGDVLHEDGCDAQLGERDVGQRPVVRRLDLLADGGVVAGPIDLAGLGDHDPAAGADPLERRPMREVLGLVVVAEEPLGEVASVALVDDPTVGIARHVDRRYDDDPVETGGREGIEHAQRRPDVGVVHGRSLARIDADPVHAGEMDRGVAPAHRVDDRGRPRQIALPEVDADRGELLATRRIADDGRHPVAAVDEPAYDGRPDEPGPTRDEDPHQPLGPRARACGGLSRSGYPAPRPRARP